MRICFLSNLGLDSPTTFGRTFPVARELAKRHEVHFLMLHADFCESERFLKDGVRCQYVGQAHIRRHEGIKEYFSTARLLTVSARSAFGLVTEALRRRADIYHVSKPLPLALLPGVMLRLSGKRVFLDTDDPELLQNIFSHRYQRQVILLCEKFLSRLFGTVTVASRRLGDYMASLGVPRRVVRYVPNGIDLQEFDTAADVSTDLAREFGLGRGQVILFMGKLDTQKGNDVDLLFGALELALDGRDDATALIVGDGPDRARLEAFAWEGGLKEKIVFAGRRPRREMPSVLKLADICVLPYGNSLRSTARSPIKLLEYMAAGTAIVASDLGDARRYLGGDAGVLVKPDPHALAAAIGELLDSPPSQAEYGRRARDRVERHFQWCNLSREFETIYGNGRL